MRLKMFRHDRASLKRIAADKSHSVIVASLCESSPTDLSRNASMTHSRLYKEQRGLSACAVFSMSPHIPPGGVKTYVIKVLKTELNSMTQISNTSF